MTRNRFLPALKSLAAGKKKKKRYSASRNISQNAGKVPEKPAAASRAGSAFRGENKDTYVKSDLRKISRRAHRSRRGNPALSLIRYPVFLINRVARFIKKTSLKKRIAFISVAAVLLIIGIVIAVAPAAHENPAYAVAGLKGAAATNTATSETLPELLPPTTRTAVPTTEPEPSEAVSPERINTPDQKPTHKPSAEPTAKPTQRNASADLNELIKFYQVEADKYYSNYGYSSNHYEYTDSELRMLAQVITREAGGESYEGQLAVGNVVMNRVLSGHWGKTIESVITAPNQFSYKPETTPKASCLIAAADVLKNEHWVVPQNAYFFKVDKTPGDDWGVYKYCVKIGGHCFYTHKIGSRNTKGGIPPALYERVFKWPQYGCKPAKRISRIQFMLSSLGYKVGQDGYFGKSTKDALSDFQKNKKLKADGVAGSATLKALIKAYGIDKYRSKYKA